MDNLPILNNIRGDVKPLSEPKSGTSGIDKEKLKKACTEFEAVFINQLLQFMRRTVPSSKPGVLESGKDVYQSLFDQELSNSMAKRGGLKIGEMVYKQMMRRGEKKAVSVDKMNPLPTTKLRSEEK
jgi:Rod binding domain-containing protein